MARTLTAFVVLLFAMAEAIAQVPFEKVVADLGSPDPNTRFHAVRLLRDSAYPESALPLAPLLNDPLDEIQLETISAELNIFLTEKGMSRRRVALIVEVRDRIDGEEVFSRGPFVLTADPVPPAVFTALLGAVADPNPEVARDALYAFGILSANPAGAARHALLAEALPHLSRLLSSRQGTAQTDVVRVIGRAYARQPGDPPIDQALGDGLVNMLNVEGPTREATMIALGAMRYERGVAALLDLSSFYGQSDLGTTALGALARIAHPSSLARFLEERSNRERERRRAAIEGIVRLGNPERLKDIEAAVVGDQEPRLNLAVSYARSALGRGRIEPIVEGIPRLADQALEYLVDLAPARTAELVVQLTSPHPDVRRVVADALGYAGDASAIQALEALRVDVEPVVANAGARAAARLRQRSLR